MRIFMILGIVSAIMFADSLKCLDNELESCSQKAFDFFNKKEYEKARILWEKACENSYTKACFDLALLYESNNYSKKDYKKAVSLYENACDREFALACNNLGLMYKTGKGVRKNLRKARDYFNKSCNLGGIMSCEEYKRLNEII